jgi:hypothetical protein
MSSRAFSFVAPNRDAQPAASRNGYMHNPPSQSPDMGRTSMAQKPARSFLPPQPSFMLPASVGSSEYMNTPYAQESTPQPVRKFQLQSQPRPPPFGAPGNLFGERTLHGVRHAHTSIFPHDDEEDKQETVAPSTGRSSARAQMDILTPKQEATVCEKHHILERCMQAYAYFHIQTSILCRLQRWQAQVVMAMVRGYIPILAIYL